MGNVITLAPPLVVNREHIDLAITILDESLSEAEATL
jgi:4-aminobutyrate aminotransferase-like enzyme